MNYLYSVLIGYGLGCIQAAYLFSHLVLKEDIREKGNGNAGASNMTVAYGKKFGLAVAVVDIVKATVAVLIVKHLFKDTIDLNVLTYTTGLFVILGHNYPFYMGFKGGKGTASLVGMLFGLSPLMGFTGLFILVAATFISDYIVIGTFSLLLSFIVMTHFMTPGLVPLLISILVGLLSLYKHRTNINNIINKEEKSVRGTLLKKKAEK